MRFLPYARLSPQINRFSRSISCSEAIRASLEVDILPARTHFPRKFSDTDIWGDRYHSGRVSLDPHISSFPEGDGQYEQLMEYYFWKGLNSTFPESRHEPELYITGPVGCGKSTFVDYYLRHYCPEKGKHPREFDKKLVVFFDARALEYHKEANEAFYQELQRSIEQHCKEHDITLYNKTRRGAISHAHESLELLSDLCQTSDLFRYLVVVLDNLDNCSVAVQRQVIRYVNEIRRHPSITLYRVIIPLWPTTYDTFSQSTEALTLGKPRISLGPPKEREFINKRLRVVKQSVLRESKISMTDGSRSTAIECQEFEAFVDFVFASLQSERIGALIRDLANDDLRRELRLWEGILRSASAEVLHKMHEADPTRHYEYEWMDALIAGDSRARGEEKPWIANLFNMLHESHSATDVLCGFHACQLLVHQPKRNNWYLEMIELGYGEDQIGGLEESLRRYNLLHPVPENYANEDFEVHRRAVEAYLSVIAHPAYVDNIAMLTPLDRTTAARIYQSSGHIKRDFEQRAESSTAFIEFICGEEKEFICLFRGKYDQNPLVLLGKLQWLNKKRFRSAAFAMADLYMERLSGLKKKGFVEDELRIDSCIQRLQAVKDSFRSGYLI